MPMAKIRFPSERQPYLERTVNRMEEQKPKRKRIYLKVFMDTETKDVIKARAREQAGLSASAYLLKCGLEETITPPLPTQVVKDINGFGRNLNQLTHVANATGTVSMSQLDELKHQAGEIIRLLKKETR